MVDRDSRPGVLRVDGVGGTLHEEKKKKFLDFFLRRRYPGSTCVIRYIGVEYSFSYDATTRPRGLKPPRRGHNKNKVTQLSHQVT